MKRRGFVAGLSRGQWPNPQWSIGTRDKLGTKIVVRPRLSTNRVNSFELHGPLLDEFVRESRGTRYARRTTGRKAITSFLRLGEKPFDSIESRAHEFRGLDFSNEVAAMDESCRIYILWFRVNCNPAGRDARSALVFRRNPA